MTAEISTRQEVLLLSDREVKDKTSSKTIMGVGEKKTYTLSYFNVRGRAEPIRMLFALAEVDYTDKRISHVDWPALKSATPFGQLPVLEVSGDNMKAPLTLSQTNSILRYLAREFGLDGRTSSDKVKVDMIVETMRDSINPITEIFNETDENKRNEVLFKYSEDLLPRFLNYLTENLSSEWFLDQVSLADAVIYVAFDNISMFLPDFLDRKSYWKLREWRSRFESHPKICEWLSIRPTTAY
ncbi:HPGDS [Bugula neritina]|uniref:glutathione transferase n=1 Tax=Bugula neritina TaxID=10212 RepID=A0A7J7KP80_BUGNE|nr:HPGDS [Bugula neritina]